MNIIEIKAEHKVFLTYRFDRFDFCYKNVKVELSSSNNVVEIKLSGKKGTDGIFEVFYTLFDMLFLILGGYPEIQEIFVNREKKDISDWSRKFETSSQFMQRDLMIADISIQNINENSLRLLETVHRRSLYSLQYLVCKEYEHIVTDHKFVLISHTIDGLVRHSYFENQLEQKVRLVNPKAKVEYKHRVELVFEPLFRYHKKYNCEILKALGGTTKAKLISTISDTRNDFSHFLDKKMNRLYSGSDMLYYFYIIYFSIRLFITADIINMGLDDERIKEYLYSLHDWICLKKNKDFDNFKSVAYLQYERRKELDRLLKLAENNN